MNNPDAQTQQPNPIRTDRRVRPAGSPWTSELYECTCGQEIANSRTPFTDKDDYVHHFDGTPCHVHHYAAGRINPKYARLATFDFAIRPGSICADHGCTVVHPGCTHANYVVAYQR